MYTQTKLNFCIPQKRNKNSIFSNPQNHLAQWINQHSVYTIAPNIPNMSLEYLNCALLSPENYKQNDYEVTYSKKIYM